MNITFEEYQQRALTTAVYPRQYVLMGGETVKPNSPSCVYPVFGLCGEIGEVAQVITSTPISKTDLAKECGDILWYVAAICSDLSIRMSDVAGYDVFDVFSSGVLLKQYVESKDLLIELFVAAGIVAEATKKTIRDSNGIVTPQRLLAITDALMRVLVALSNLCTSHGLSFGAVAQMNLDKLAARAAKGAIQGSGSNR